MTETKPPLMVEKDGAVTTISINDAPWNRMSMAILLVCRFLIIIRNNLKYENLWGVDCHHLESL